MQNPISITTPKKYIKGKDDKLVLNPEYKRWMEGKLRFEYNQKTHQIECNVNSTPLPTAVAVEVDDNDYDNGEESEVFDDLLEKTKRESENDKLFHIWLENKRNENENKHQLEMSKKQQLESEQHDELLRSEQQRLNAFKMAHIENEQLKNKPVKEKLRDSLKKLKFRSSK